MRPAVAPYHCFALLSSVAGTAIRQAAAGVDVVSPDECGAFGLLIYGRLPGHVENLVPGPDEFLRIAVTVETPFHVKGVRSPGDRHLIDPPVASGATDSFRHMHAVIEIDVVRQIVNPVPLERRVRGEAFPHRCEQRHVAKDLGMTMHAGLAGGHAGETRLLD